MTASTTLWPVDGYSVFRLAAVSSNRGAFLFGDHRQTGGQCIASRLPCQPSRRKVSFMAAKTMPISDDLRNAITGSGKTITALSRECGVDHAALSRFVRKERGITIETADKLADYFHLRLTPEEEKPKRKKKPSG